MAVRLATLDSSASVLLEGGWTDIGTGVGRDGQVALTSDGIRRQYAVRLGAHSVAVNGPEGQSTFALRAEDERDEGAAASGECRAPLPGAVTKVLVAVGEVVAEGDGLVVLEAMKMEHTLRAGGAGTVTEVRCAPGQQVDVGDLLVAVEAT
jgi:biotin carboxyl carrier protein